MKFDFEKTAASHPRAEAARRLYSNNPIASVASKAGKTMSRRHGGVAYQDGGGVEGPAAAVRADKPGRYADGGAVKGEPRTKINIIVAPQNGGGDDKGKEALAGLLAAGGGQPPAPPAPPMGAPPMGAPPMGGGMPLGLKHGGRASGPDMDGGAGGGLGRLEKAKDAKRSGRKIGKNL